MAACSTNARPAWLAALGVEVAGLLAATIGRLCEGEVRELRAAYDINRTEDAYLQSIRGKTASLFATACRIGAIVGGLDRPSVDALTEFGIALPARRSTSRHFCRLCLDWTERRPHIAGALGAAMTKRYFDLRWLEKTKRSHAVVVTPIGRRGFQKTFGIDAFEPSVDS